MRVKFALAPAFLLSLFLLPQTLLAQEDPRDRRIAELEETVRQLVDEVRELQKDKDTLDLPEGDEELDEIDRHLDAYLAETGTPARHWTNRFTIGGYADLHWNLESGGGKDQFDIHRFVLFIGHRFSEYLNLTSELEIEHAAVKDGGGGELTFEQLYLDFLVGEATTIRAGRMLIPMGITNLRHDPPAFNGVERPLFDTVIIPTTWFSDGVGIVGPISPELAYQAFLVTGLDGSKFNALDGIRGGRIKERPSLNDPALTARLDVFPLARRSVDSGQVLRFAVSGYYGGLDNGNKGGDPGIDGDLGIVSADFEYTIDRFDFRGAGAIQWIDGAREIGNGTANVVAGWYLEAALHLLPSGIGVGPFRRSDLVIFTRYEWVDTQYRMPNGIDADPRGTRTEWVLGLGFYLQPNVVLKLDYRIRDDKSGDEVPNLTGIGIGWQF